MPQHWQGCVIPLAQPPVPADALLLKPALSSSQPVSFRDLFRSSFAKQNEFTATPRFTGSSGNIRSRRILGTCGHSKSSFRRSRRRQHSDASGASALLRQQTPTRYRRDSMIGDSVIKGRIFWCLLVLFMAIGNAGAQLATDCTLYVSPSGGGNGASPSAPTTLGGAQNASGPGDVICIMGGTYSLGSTFNVTNSGTSSAWIVYKAYGNSAVNVNWTGPSGPGNTMFRIGQQGTFPNGPHYLEINGLNLDGKNLATNGFSCGGAHHLRFLNNTVKNTGGAGIATIECDYLTSDHNIIFHNGYAPCCGWTSAISYNSNQFLNTNAGLHSIISNNILA